MESLSCCWDIWVEEAVAKLQSLKLLFSLRTLIPKPTSSTAALTQQTDDLDVFDEVQPRDRLSVEIDIAETTVGDWLLNIPSPGTLCSIRDDPTYNDHADTFKLTFHLCIEKISKTQLI